MEKLNKEVATKITSFLIDFFFSFLKTTTSNELTLTQIFQLFKQGRQCFPLLLLQDVTSGFPLLFGLNKNDRPKICLQNAPVSIRTQETPISVAQVDLS